MTSQLNVDTIVDKAGSGGSNVKMANTSTYVSDGGAVTQNTVQGLTKVWCNLNGSTFGLRDSFSVSSAVDEGTGNYDIFFSNTMGNDNYSSVATGDGTGVANIIGVDTSLGRSSSPTTFCTLSTKTSSAISDVTYVYLNINGDLA
tara:strand:+ start:35 stop:469 length:435 start_codon:yes stop_codon:yes gene_type:complete